MARLDVIYALTGCTAVGKTELSLRWAEANNAEIVSCDSLLFYRGLNIGTAKPTSGELSRVPHHLIDIREPSEGLDVADYLDLAIDIVDEIQARGKKVLVTGGSGFYLKAYFSPVVDAVEVPERIREEVANLMEHEPLKDVSERLRKLNPDGIGNLDTMNPRRVSKALERCLASGKTLEALRRDMAATTNPLIEAPKKFIRLDRDKGELEARIEKRVDTMLAEGLIDEVAALRDRGIEANASAAMAIGYRETLAHLRGELDRSELRERIVINTRRLAKKQRTWFRTQLPPHEVIDLTITKGEDVRLFG